MCTFLSAFSALSMKHKVEAVLNVTTTLFRDEIVTTHFGLMFLVIKEGAGQR